jgi:hypothetical protein
VPFDDIAIADAPGRVEDDFTVEPNAPRRHVLPSLVPGESGLPDAQQRRQGLSCLFNRYRECVLGSHLTIILCGERP